MAVNLTIFSWTKSTEATRWLVSSTCENHSLEALYLYPQQLLLSLFTVVTTQITQPKIKLIEVAGIRHDNIMYVPIMPEDPTLVDNTHYLENIHPSKKCLLYDRH